MKKDISNPEAEDRKKEKMTEAQILMLNNLIYDPVFTLDGAEAFCVGELLDFIDTDVYKKQEGVPGPGTTKEEWDNLIALAKEDEQLCSLRIVEKQNDKKTGAKALCFYWEEGKEAIVVFAGTGYNEWRDDLIAGAKEDSKQQLDALEWFDALPYEKITVSGHSKGGNKAMYVAVRSEKEPVCIAFDGEGFSKEFCQKYEEQIQKRKENITLYANYRDFVNCLLYPIAGTVVFLKNDGGIAEDELGFGGYHCPDALFLHEDGKILYELAKEGAREPAIELIQEFTIYFMEKVPKAERIQMLSFLGDIMQRIVGKGEYRNDILKTIGLDAGRDLLIYLRAFLKNKKEVDPKGYHREITSLMNILGEFAGISDAAKVIFPILAGYAEDKNVFAAVFNMTREIEHQIVIRDFSQETKERMLQAAKEVEREPFWKISRWDCWYRLEERNAGLNLSMYVNHVEEYYRKLIDLNDAAAWEIEKIFEDVLNIDQEYGQKIRQENENLREKKKRLDHLIHK